MASTLPARPRSGLGSPRRRTPGTSGRHPSSGTASVGSAGATDPVTDTLLAAPPRSPYARSLISAKPVRMLKLIPNDPLVFVSTMNLGGGRCRLDRRKRLQNAVGVLRIRRNKPGVAGGPLPGSL